MHIVITDFAKNELRQIYEYYASEASKTVAQKIINKIIDEIETIGKLPQIGSREPLLQTLENNYRYVVCGNYKIIFYKVGETIFITDIFDCRQNPEKIGDRNK